MRTQKTLRYAVIAVFLLLGLVWSLASAQDGGQSYPNADFLASPEWIRTEAGADDVALVDVRTDKYFDGRLIPGAIRMPWALFRYNDTARNIGDVFVGTARAQEILGEHGIARNDTVILYDSVERDGGATASYLFWVLEVLGHEKIRILERGINAWIDAGGETTDSPATREAVLYQAPSNEIDLSKAVTGDFIRNRLGDPYYQILDVRSKPEYLGEAPNVGLDGSVLKLGHIPTAYNVDYTLNWADSEVKTLKSHADLQALYRGIDPNRSVITYCHSARRGSFGYFALRLMGFSDVRLYTGSWNEWGNKRFFYPVETAANVPAGKGLPGVTAQRATSGGQAGGMAPSSGSGGAKKGYISCGG